MAPSLADDFYGLNEGKIRRKVLNGLRLALNDELAAGSQTDRRDLTKTEEEKLLHFAVRDFDLPLTYSWYLAGIKYRSNTGSSAQTASPDSPEWSPSPDTSLKDTHSDFTHPDSAVEFFRQYYRDGALFADYTLKEIVYMPKTKFLCKFYEEFADEPYRDLYIHSTKLRQKLDQIDDLIETADAEVTLSDWGGGSEDGILKLTEEKDFRRLVSEIQLDLAQIDDLNRTRIPVRDATDEIEIVLTKLTHLSSLTDEQQTIITNLSDFFYNFIWKYPALKISAGTATGPGASELSRRRERQFSNFHDRLIEKTDQFRERRVDAGLRPSSEEFAANEKSELVESVHKMTRDSFEDI